LTIWPSCAAAHPANAKVTASAANSRLTYPLSCNRPGSRIRSRERGRLKIRWSH
jgi:hypothetical protein